MEAYMADKMEQSDARDMILESAWASIISGAATQNEETVTPSSCQTWEELRHFKKRIGSMETMQRLPSLGRWISMGQESWEKLFDGIVSTMSREEASIKPIGVRRMPWGKYAAEFRDSSKKWARV